MRRSNSGLIAPSKWQCNSTFGHAASTSVTGTSPARRYEVYCPVVRDRNTQHSECSYRRHTSRPSHNAPRACDRPPRHIAVQNRAYRVADAVGVDDHCAVDGSEVLASAPRRVRPDQCACIATGAAELPPPQQPTAAGSSRAPTAPPKTAGHKAAPPAPSQSRRKWTAVPSRAARNRYYAELRRHPQLPRSVTNGGLLSIPARPLAGTGMSGNRQPVGRTSRTRMPSGSQPRRTDRHP